MNVQVAELLLGVRDPYHGGSAADRAGIADLAARLAVERRLVGDHHHLAARLGALRRLTADHQRPDLRLRALVLVTEELGCADRLAHFEPDPLLGLLARALPARPGLGALALHGRIEPGEIDGHAARAQRILGEIERKAVGVVQPERGCPGQLSARAQVRGRLLEQAQTALERVAKARLLELQHFGDQRLRTHQLGEGLAHLGDQHRHEAPHQRLARTKHVGVAHGAAHDPAQHVAAPFVRGHDAVGDQERAGAQVIGDHLVRGAVRAGRTRAGQLLARLDDAAEQIDVVVVVQPLEHRRDALEAHAGVNRGPGQRLAPAGRDLLELHEHQVPDLDEAVAGLVGAARRPARHPGPVVVEDLRARPARPGIAHRPEIVGGGDAQDPALGQPRDLPPQRERLVVLGIDRDQQPVRRQSVLPGHQVPGELDRHVLEVVAEREVAEHLEEGVVPGGVADVVEVVVLAAGAHALLRRGRAPVRPLLDAGEHVLELHHAGVGEQQRRVVVRHERARGHDLMAVLPEILEEGLADLVGAGHRSDGNPRVLSWPLDSGLPPSGKA